MANGSLAPLAGAVMTNYFPVVSGLRPPATLFRTLRVAPRSVNYMVTLAKPRLGLNSDRCSAAREASRLMRHDHRLLSYASSIYRAGRPTNCGKFLLLNETLYSVSSSTRSPSNLNVKVE